MKNRGRKLASWLLLLALMLSQLPATALAQGEETDPEAPEIQSWTPAERTLAVQGVAGQEYAIVPQNNGTLDWSAAVEPNAEGYVVFSGLACATTYGVYTRIKGGSGRSVMTEYTTGLEDYGYVLASEPVLGQPITITVTPEDADVMYQWYYDDGESGYTQIQGATTASYTPYGEENAGKKLAVGIMTRGYVPLEVVDDIGPVYAPAESANWTDTSIRCAGKEGQEYIIQYKDTEPAETDWDAALKPAYNAEYEDWFVTFEGLSPATSYEIYTRPVGFANNGVKSRVITTDLSEGVVVTGPERCTVGATLTVTTVPIVDYQWCYEVVLEEGDGWSRSVSEPIPGATGASYTITEYDAGKKLTVLALVDGIQIDKSSMSFGPVEETEGAPELASWDPFSVDVRGVAGNEYVIAQKGNVPDWSNAIEPEADGRVSFTGLTPATEYDIHTRAKDDTGDGMKKAFVTPLESCGIDYTGDLTVGSVLTANTEPENDALQYRWYRAAQYDGPPKEIYGATGKTYRTTEEDLGRVISFKAFINSVAVGDTDSYETVKANYAQAPVKPRITGWFPTGVMIEGVFGQEYLIAERGTVPTDEDWENADWQWMLEGEIVTFEDLAPATEYDIYTRLMGNGMYMPSVPVKTELMTHLSFLERSGDLIAGDTLEVTTEEGVTGITYQWCEEVITPYRDSYGYETERIDYLPIEGATDSTYLLTAKDAGKTLGVRLLKNGTEVGSMEDIGPVAATATVEFDSDGGSEVAEQTGIAYGGTVTEPANPVRSGYSFLGWYHDDTAWDFDSDTVTADYLVLTAKWQRIQSSSSGSAGSTAAVKDIPSGESGGVRLSATVSGTTAQIRPLDDISASANEEGNTVLDVSSLETVSTVELSAGTVRQIAEALNTQQGSLVISMASGEVSFDNAAIQTIAQSAAGVSFSNESKTIDSLNAKQKEALNGINAVSVIRLSLSASGKPISDFGGGSVEISVPFVPENGYRGSDYTVYYAREDGILEKQPTACTNNRLTFVTTHFSDFVITCQRAVFEDVADDVWYNAAVYHCYDRGYFLGTNSDRFAPEDTMTRAMFATVLYRMAGEPGASGVNPFFDAAASEWYSDAVAWAAEKNILNGYGDGTFGAGDPVTREQMAVILYRYAQFAGVDVSSGGDSNLLSYDDASDVSEWAIYAMQWAVGSGVINGRSEQTLNPKDTASRAEVAQIIMNYDTNAV